MNVLARLQNIFLRAGIFIAKRQGSESVSQLLDYVWPVKTEKSLIRIGSEIEADGGYLVPDDLQDIDRVFSPGVADTMDFEQYFLDRGVPCEMLDGSVSSPPQPHALATFKKLWLSASTDDGSISLDDWVRQASLPEEELVLQMDIEGAEYEVLLAVSPETLQRFRVIVLELHDLRSVMSRSGLILFKTLMKKLKASHEIVHAHPNNCCRGVRDEEQVWPDVLELTFLNRSRFVSNLGPADLPHPLDRDNTHKTPIVLRRAA